MDHEKIGALLKRLRTEKGMTQRETAEKLFVSDKAVSKWERGLGCPDISSVNNIAALFGVSAESLLNGELNTNGRNGGNMKRIKFYVCPECGNTFTAATGTSAELSCCGRKLLALEAAEPDAAHKPEIHDIDDELYITFPHEMTKKHYISFAAAVGSDRSYMHRLYPEQDAAARIPRIGWEELYFYCSEHGLMKIKL